MNIYYYIYEYFIQVLYRHSNYRRAPLSDTGPTWLKEKGKFRTNYSTELEQRLADKEKVEDSKKDKMNLIKI